MRKLKLGNKKAAFEMSITTIVILVIALSMLIFGMIFVRSMMCAGMGLMTDVTKGTRDEINNMFSAQGGEVQCLGAGDIQDVYPLGTMQNVYCGFNVDEANVYYEFIVKDQPEVVDGLDKTQLIQWMNPVPKKKISVPPGTDSIVPIMYLNIPKNAPQGFFTFDVTPVRYVGSSAGVSQTPITLQFNIKRAGAVQSAIC
jgi:hypothetical protein